MKTVDKLSADLICCTTSDVIKVHLLARDAEWKERVATLEDEAYTRGHVNGYDCGTSDREVLIADWQNRLDSAISDAARSFKVAMAESKVRIEAARREGWAQGVCDGIKYMRTCFDRRELVHTEAFIAKGPSAK